MAGGEAATATAVGGGGGGGGGGGSGVGVAWVAAHVAAVALGVGGFAATAETGVLFSWHPALLAAGYLLLLAEGVLQARRVACGARRHHLRVHLWLQTAAAGLVLLGLAAVALHKERSGRPHLRSPHALVGAAAAAATLGQAGGGLLLYFVRRRLLRAFGTVAVLRMVRLHAQAAVACHAAVLAAFLLALRTGYAAARWSATLRLLLAAALVAWALLTLFARPPLPPPRGRRARPSAAAPLPL